MINKEELKIKTRYDLESSIGTAEDISKKYWSDDFDDIINGIEKAMKIYLKKLKRELNKLK